MTLLRLILLAIMICTGDLAWAGKVVSFNKSTWQGVYVFDDGSRYKGAMKADGTFSGKGVMTWPDGARFEGEYCNGKRVHGRLHSPDGGVHEGGYDDNENYSGKGVMTWPDGQRFEGHFNNGDYHGFGVMTYVGGQHFEGEYRNDKKLHGRFQLASGVVYEGGFDDNGNYSGKGVMTWPNGPRFEGEYRNGKKLHGRFQLASGVVYEGGFDDNGNYSGKGVMTWLDGARFVGEYRNDERVKGVMTWPDGQRFEGEYRNNKRLLGRFQYPGGHVYEGAFDDNGNESGVGIYTWPSGQRYVGKFHNGKFHGQGVMTNSDGSSHPGEWANGERTKWSTTTATNNNAANDAPVQTSKRQSSGMFDALVGGVVTSMVDRSTADMKSNAARMGGVGGAFLGALADSNAQKNQALKEKIAEEQGDNAGLNMVAAMAQNAMAKPAGTTIARSGDSGRGGSGTRDSGESTEAARNKQIAAECMASSKQNTNQEQIDTLCWNAASNICQYNQFKDRYKDEALKFKLQAKILCSTLKAKYGGGVCKAPCDEAFR